MQRRHNLESKYAKYGLPKWPISKVQPHLQPATVAVGSHGTIGSQEMQRIARVTGGKYYVVKNASALPKIYQKEARRVARPLVYEDKAGIVPRVKFPHEMIKRETMNKYYSLFL